MADSPVGVWILILGLLCQLTLRISLFLRLRFRRPCRLPLSVQGRAGVVGSGGGGGRVASA